MRNYWLTQIFLDKINDKLRSTSLLSGDVNSFVDAYFVVVEYIETNDPTFKLHPHFKQLDLCYKRGRGFFVELVKKCVSH